MTEVVDRYMQLKHPDRWAELQDSCASTLEPLENVDAESAQELLREKKRRYLARFDASLLDALGFSIDDAIRAKEHQANNRTAGAHRPKHLDGGIDAALQSFVESEKQGHDHAEAVKAAQYAADQVCRTPIHRKTIAAWLNELIAWGVTTIPRAQRGRPKKEK